jgi:hypothetical protein
VYDDLVAPRDIYRGVIIFALRNTDAVCGLLIIKLLAPVLELYRRHKICPYEITCHSRVFNEKPIALAVIVGSGRACPSKRKVWPFFDIEMQKN